MDTPSTKRILLIEDDPAIALMYQTLLTKAGYEVTHKKDGQEGWDTLTTQEPPDLLLLDVVTPRKDGFEVLRDIRKHPKLHHLKVVLLTNLAQEVDRRAGEKLQATDYVVKAHTEPHELLEKVKGYLAQP